MTPKLETKMSRISFWLRMHVLRWSLISGFMKNRIPQAASIIPIAGYAILWSKSFEDVLQYRAALDSFAWFGVETRLYFIYFGAISLMASLGVFRLRCPSFIQRHSSIDGYILEQKETAANHIINSITQHASQLVSGVGTAPSFSSECGFILREQLSLETQSIEIFRVDQNSYLRIYYLQHEDKRLISIIVSSIFLLFGLVLILAPSFEVFFLVARSIISTWMPLNG